MLVGCGSLTTGVRYGTLRNVWSFRVRNILKAGAAVFGASALLLLVAPSLFLDLLVLDATSDELVWAMRMIGLTLIALAGNMWMNSLNPDNDVVRNVAVVMAVAASGLGFLTLLIPGQLHVFSVLYAIVGFSFGFAYITALILKKY